MGEVTDEARCPVRPGVAAPDVRGTGSKGSKGATRRRATAIACGVSAVGGPRDLVARWEAVEAHGPAEGLGESGGGGSASRGGVHGSCSARGGPSGRNGAGAWGRSRSRTGGNLGNAKLEWRGGRMRQGLTRPAGRRESPTPMPTEARSPTSTRTSETDFDATSNSDSRRTWSVERSVAAGTGAGGEDGDTNLA
jgi:hypothetical protein